MKTFILLSLVSLNCFAVKIDIVETRALALDDMVRSYDLSLNEVEQLNEGKLRVKCGEEHPELQHPSFGLLKGQTAVINSGEAVVHCR